MLPSWLFAIAASAFIRSSHAANECKITPQTFVTNSPANIARVLHDTESAIAEGDYRVKPEEGLRLYLLLGEKERAEVFKLLLPKALEVPPQHAPKVVPALIDLILRDALARGLWEKARKDLPSSPRLSELEKLLKKYPPTFTLSDIQERLNTKPKSATAFLSSLPKEFRKSHTALFDSGSRQESSAEDPRGLFYSEDVAIGFNGNSAHQHFDEVEFLYLNPHTAMVEMYQIAPGAKDASPVVLSAKNPQACFGCHGSPTDPHGKWLSYNFWRGAIAGHDDAVAPDKTVEATSLATLKKKAAEGHPRYSLLEGLATRFPNHREAEILRQPNGELNRVLNLHSMTRMLRLMAATPNYCQFRYAVIAAVSGCPDIPSFLPEHLRRNLPPYASFVTKTEALKKKLQDEFAKAYPGATRSPVEFFESTGIANLRYLFEGRGISMNGWSTDMLVGYGWSDGEADLTTYGRLLRWAYQDIFDDYPLHKIGVRSPVDCAWFKERSLAALDRVGLETAPPPRPVITPHAG